MIRMWLLFFTLLAGGRAQAPPVASHEVEEDEIIGGLDDDPEMKRMIIHAMRGEKLLDRGEIRVNQAVSDLLNLSNPYRVDTVGRFTFIDYFPVPNLTGLSLIAIDGHLVFASKWGCTFSLHYFDSTTADDMAAIDVAQGERLQTIFNERE